MGSKFLPGSSNDLSAVSDGSLDIKGASIGAQNLTPGFPIKIDSERKLYSTALAIADVVNLQSELDATIQTPYSGTIEATDFKTASVPSLNTLNIDVATAQTDITTLEAKTIHISAPNNCTAIVGQLAVFDPGDDPTTGVTPMGAIICGNLASNDYITAFGGFQGYHGATFAGTAPVTAPDFITASVPSLNAAITTLNNTTQNIATTATVTNITGKLQFNSVPVLQETSTRNFTTTGTITGALTTCSDLATDTYISLNTILNEHNVGMTSNKVDIGVLETKTQSLGSDFVENTFARGEFIVLHGPTVSGCITAPTIRATTGGLVSTAGASITGDVSATNLITGSGNFNAVAELSAVLETKTQSLGSDFVENTFAMGEFIVLNGGTVNGYIAAPTIRATASLVAPAINGLTPIGGKYQQTGNDVQVGPSSTTETSIVSSGVGSLLFSPTEFTLGSSYHVRLGGLFESNNKRNLQLRMTLGGVDILNTGFMELADLSGGPFAYEIEIDFIVKSAGALGSVYTSGAIGYVRRSPLQEDNGWRGQAFGDIVAVDLTQSRVLDITFQWEQNDSGLTITNQALTVSKTY
jgi:hypothetical protein